MSDFDFGMSLIMTRGIAPGPFIPLRTVDVGTSSQGLSIMNPANYSSPYATFGTNYNSITHSDSFVNPFASSVSRYENPGTELRDMSMPTASTSAAEEQPAPWTNPFEEQEPSPWVQHFDTGSVNSDHPSFGQGWNSEETLPEYSDRGSVASFATDNTIDKGISEAADFAETAEEVTETAEAVESGATGGAGAVLMASQIAAQGANSYLSADIDKGITSQFQSNTRSPGLNSGLNASLIAQHNMQNAKLIDAGGSIGSTLGPLGMLMGRSIASNFTSDISMNTLDTAYSAYGRINPQSDNVNITQSSLGVSDEDYANGAQATAASSSQDSSAITDGNSAN